MRKKMMSTERHYVVPVGRTMLQMNSGFAATYVRNGFMVNASRSHLPELSISSSTSVLHAAIKELALSVDRDSLAPNFPKTLCLLPWSIGSFLVQVSSANL